METYIGTKIIEAERMSRGVYNEYRGWCGKAGDDPAEAGYRVVYPDGYISWSPMAQFEEAYRRSDALPFGLAIEAMKKGFKVARAGWNGKDMFIVYMSPLSLPPFNTEGTARKVNDRTAKWIGEDTPLNSNGYFAMFTADKKWQPGWLASQSDMLADDWAIIE